MPPKSDIDYITEFLNDHDASGYAKTVRELAEENERLRGKLERLATAAADAAADFEKVGAYTPARVMRIVVANANPDA